MTILIDPAVWPAHGTVWSHLVSDASYEELHAFARAQGIPRRAFDLDHYDVPLERHDELVAAGAVAVASRELLRRIQLAGLRVRQIDRALVEDARRDEFLAAEWRLLGASPIAQERPTADSHAAAGVALDASSPARDGARPLGADPQPSGPPPSGSGRGTSAAAPGRPVAADAPAPTPTVLDRADGTTFAATPASDGAPRTPPRADDRADAWARLGADLLDRWREPHRAYHGVRHLEDVLLGLDQLRTWGEPVSPAAFLAAWFHDAVYAGAPGDDERASAELARISLRDAGAPGALADRVARLVLATIPGTRRAVGEPQPAEAVSEQEPRDAGDELAGAAEPITGSGGTTGASGGTGIPPVDVDVSSGVGDERADEDALLDADLAILAAGAPRYAWYTAAVRREYAHVPDDAFRAGRAAVLEGILASERIYVTDAAHARWELRARTNLAAEIAALRA